MIVPVGAIHGSYSANDATLRLDDYFGSILYENGTAEDAAHHPLTKVMTPEGYVDYATAGKPYCYYRQDHLGSIREVDSYSGNNRTVVQKTQYYPSGTSFQENFGAGEQPYKFTGKELITMHGLNWQDFGARWLDNVRLQFTSVDPLAEKYYSISPYAYCLDSPVRLIDPNGKSVYSIDSEGHIKLVADNKDKNDQLYKLNKNGELIKNKTHLNLNKGILENYGSKVAKTKDGDVSYNTLKFNNEKAADSFFNWTAKNTSVEWSIVTVGNDNTITTTHKPGNEVGGQNELIEALSNGANTAKDKHDHPYEKNQNAPSGFGMYNDPTPPNKGDRGAALQIKTLFPNANVTFQVYDVYTNGTINFNSEKFDDEKPE